MPETNPFYELQLSVEMFNCRISFVFLHTYIEREKKEFGGFKLDANGYWYFMIGLNKITVPNCYYKF